MRRLQYAADMRRMCCNMLRICCSIRMCVNSTRAHDTCYCIDSYFSKSIIHAPKLYICGGYAALCGRYAADVLQYAADMLQYAADMRRMCCNMRRMA